MDRVDRFFEAFLVPLPPAFLPDFFVLFAAFFVVLRAPPFLPAFAADFLVDFFDDFFDDFFVDFFAPPRACRLPALFFVPLPPPLRAPLDFLAPFLAAIWFAPLVGLGLAQRSKIIQDCHDVFSR